jgi:P pilus assembly chaperone PapD
MAMTKDVWNDISVETERTYIYSDYELTIKNPEKLHVSVSSLGGHAHRITTKDGVAYYIAPGWKAISWKVAEGNPLFKF